MVIDQVDEEPEQRDQSLAACKIIYGCDYIFSPTEFMEEIIKLNWKENRN